MIEVFLHFLKLGCLGFGGPLAHTSLFHDYFVKRKNWISEKDFLESSALTQLIPGPNSTELAMHIGYKKAGWPGFVAAGVGFILPACSLVYALALLYEQRGWSEEFSHMLWAIKPIITAIILFALYKLKDKALDSFSAVIAALIGLGVYLLGASEFSSICITACASLLWQKKFRAAFLPLFISGLPLLTKIIFQSGAASQVSSWGIFSHFFQISSMVFGSGYVLYSYMEKRFVSELSWLGHEGLIASISAGQITPGPLFSTATFSGFLLGGNFGALAATIGIFLPSFLFGAAAIHLANRLREKDFWAPTLEAIVSLCFFYFLINIYSLIPTLLPSFFSYAFCAISLLALTWLRVSPTALLVLGLFLGFSSTFFS